MVQRMKTLKDFRKEAEKSNKEWKSNAEQVIKINEECRNREEVIADAKLRGKEFILDYLKLSAIEDIKEISKKHNKLPAVNQTDEACYKTGSIEGQMAYIKGKFNIKDEDLK